MSPHHRINLLKLIDLAIGNPTPGSVSFNLLHKVLYILAVRSGSVEHDEIELGHVGDSTPLMGRALQDAEDGRTRLMVQRIPSGADDQTLKITGSRIVVPWDQQQQRKHQRSRLDSSIVGEDETEEVLKSQLSAMSSVVSELGERVQEMSQRPDESVERLRERVDALEGLVELQMKEISKLQESIKSGAVDHIECDFPKEKSGLWKAIDALQNKIQNFNTDETREKSDNAGIIVEKEAQHNESLELNIAETNQGPVQNSLNWSLDSSMQHYEELVAKQNRFEQSLESLALETDTCYKDVLVKLQSFDDKLQSIDNSTSTKLEQLERSIERLFQQKADDVEIDSRVRMSIHQTRPSILAAPRNVDIVGLHQTSPQFEEQMIILKEQIKSTQNDQYDLRESLNGKASTEYMITLESALTDQMRQLQRDMKTLLSQKAAADDRGAAGTKSKMLQDVGCISCDREVAMRTCEEVIPQPAVLRINRTVKANLRYQLSEIRKGLELHPGSAVSNLQPVDKMYRSISQGRKSHRGK